MCLAEQFGSPGNERIAYIFRSGHVQKVDGVYNVLQVVGYCSFFLFFLKASEWE